MVTVSGPVAVVSGVRIAVPVSGALRVRRPVLDQLPEPAFDERPPVLVVDPVVRDREPGECVVPAGEEPAAPVGLQDDLHAARGGEEGHLDLVHRVRVLRRRGQLDLLVEGELLAGAADAAVLQIRGPEAESEPAECFEDHLLHRQGAHRELIEVALVLGPGDRQLRADAEHDAQALPVQLGDRCLPGQRDRERHTELRTLGQPEAAAHGEALEGHDVLLLPLLVLGLHPRDELQRDVVDVEVGAAALEMDLAGQGAAGSGRPGGEDGVDGGAAHAERAEQSFEHHCGVHSLICVRGVRGVRERRRRLPFSTDV